MNKQITITRTINVEVPVGNMCDLSIDGERFDGFVLNNVSYGKDLTAVIDSDFNLRLIGYKEEVKELVQVNEIYEETIFQDVYRCGAVDFGDEVGIGTQLTIMTKKHGVGLRVICGDEELGYITVDPLNMKIRSNICETIDELLDGYTIINSGKIIY